jgi:oligopeptidase B
MKKLLLPLLLLLVNGLKAQTPPVCTVKPKEMVMHGDKRVDNYYWLNERDNPAVIAYLEAENAYTKNIMQPTESLQETLYKEMTGRIKPNDESLPYFRNGYWYYNRVEAGKEYPIYCRKKGSLEATEEIMLNVNELAKGYKYYQVSGLAVSPDNTLLAYGVDTVSRRQYVVYFKNLITGALLKDKVEETGGGVTWMNDNKTIFFTRKHPVTLREEKVFRHRLGEDVSADKEVYFEKDETYSIGLRKTKSQQYIIITSGSTLSSEERLLDANKPDGEFRVFHPREKDMLYQADHYGDRFYVATNWKAKNFRLMQTSLTSTSKENWKEVIPNRATVLLEDIEIFKNYLVITERSNGLTQLRIIKQEGGNKLTEHYLKFDEPVYVSGVAFNPDFDTDILRFNYSSLTTPVSIYDYNMTDRSKNLMKQQEIPGGFNASDYTSERQWATARDGKKIPLSIVYKKGLVKNGKAPLLLYAYGSYGYSTDAGFNANVLSLLDRGFVYAIAHVRGGQEMGRQWYEDGKMFKKKNTFNDFIDCGEFLLKNKYSSKAHLYASGGSAGGLLMGAILNMRPDMWNGVIAAVPFVDVVTTMLDETIPLTTGEFDEWGNPVNKASYFYMKSYSPYDNIERKKYPNLLVTSGYHDSQVQYFEPAKWVAKLRVMKTGNSKLLFDCDMEAGHGGTSGRFKRLRKVAMQYAFLLDLEGIKG